MKIYFVLLFFLPFINCCTTSSFGQSVKILKGVTLIDGTEAEPKQNINLVIKGDVIDAVLPSNAMLPKGARIILTAVAEDRIAVTVDVNGTIEIRTFDLRSLKQTGRLRFVTEP